ELGGNNRVAFLSDRLWRDRFGGDPRVVGSAITLDGVPHTIVGVMPVGFTFPARSEIWLPLTVELNAHNSMLLSVLGRLRGGVTPEQVRSELAGIIAALPRDPRSGETRSVAAILPLKSVLTGRVETSLLILSGAVAFVLLIA